MIQPSFALSSFSDPVGNAFPALVVDEKVYSLFNIGELSKVRTMLDLMEDWEANWPKLAAAASRLAAVEPDFRLDRDRLNYLPPISPRQIICSGANYRNHVIALMVDHNSDAESAAIPRPERLRHAERVMDHRAAHGQPFFFIKPFSSILGPYDDLIIPADTHQLDWELELGVVIGKPARRVRRSEALQHVAGYIVANDISARDRLARPDFPELGVDWVACKGGPGFLPIGEKIIPAAFVRDPQKLTLTLRLNGEVMQHESTSNMIFPVARLIEHVSAYMQLLPGDIICTGSPSGNGAPVGRFLRPGDVLEGRISGFGGLRNRCVAEAPSDGAVLHRPFERLPALAGQ